MLFTVFQEAPSLKTMIIHWMRILRFVYVEHIKCLLVCQFFFSACFHVETASCETKQNFGFKTNSATFSNSSSYWYEDLLVFFLK